MLRLFQPSREQKSIHAEFQEAGKNNADVIAVLSDGSIAKRFLCESKPLDDMSKKSEILLELERPNGDRKQISGLGLDNSDYVYYVGELLRGNIIFAYGNPHPNHYPFKYSGLFLRIFDPLTQQYLSIPEGIHHIQAFAVSPKTKNIILGTNNEIIVLDPDAQSIKRRWKANVSALTVLSDGCIVSGDGFCDSKGENPAWIGKIIIWDSSGNPLKIWDAPTFSLTTSVDKALIISRGINTGQKLLSVWDPHTGHQIASQPDENIYLGQRPLVMLPSGELINSPRSWRLTIARDFVPILQQKAIDH